MADPKVVEQGERWHHQARRKVYKKISKKVRWNDMEFESGRALARYLKLYNQDNVHYYIKTSKPLDGFIPRYI